MISDKIVGGFMNLYLIKDNEGFYLCFQEDTEKAKEIFMNDDCEHTKDISGAEYLLPEQRIEKKRNLNPILLKPEKDYTGKALNSSCEVLFNGFDAFIIGSGQRIQPIEKLPQTIRKNGEQIPNSAREKMREFLEELVQKRSSR